jgi:hypothetical protein
VLPVLLFAPFAGPWVDRWNLRNVLITSDLLRALCVLAIPFIYNATHLATPVWTLVFLLFTCNVFFLPAKSAMTPEIVPKEQLLSANTLLAVAGIVGTIAGFAMGGWVVDHWGWPTAILMDGATYGVSVISLAFIRYRARPRPVTDVTVRGYWKEILEGVRVVRASPKVGLALTALGAVWLGGGFVQVAGIQHIQRVASIPGAERIAGLGGALGGRGAVDVVGEHARPARAAASAAGHRHGAGRRVAGRDRGVATLRRVRDRQLPGGRVHRPGVRLDRDAGAGGHRPPPARTRVQLARFHDASAAARVARGRHHPDAAVRHHRGAVHGRGVRLGRGRHVAGLGPARARAERRGAYGPALSGTTQAIRFTSCSVGARARR